MKVIVTLDEAGGIAIPRSVRDELRLHAGDIFAVETEGRRITLRPVRQNPAQREESER